MCLGPLALDEGGVSGSSRLSQCAYEGSKRQSRPAPRREWREAGGVSAGGGLEFI